MWLKVSAATLTQKHVTFTRETAVYHVVIV